MQLCSRETCTGCFACVESCPKQCITMKTGENGHIYPQIDKAACVHCGICSKVCERLKKINKKESVNTYAGWNKDLNQQKKSTSGGIGALLARKVIEKNGVVYGAAYNDQWQVEHIRVDSVEEIDRLCGSKYVHSWIGDCYKTVHKDLVAEKLVLFTGTPCQIAGLYAYLGQEYKNLITIDLVCHGVPSREIYLKELHKIADIEKLDNVKFRGDYGYGFTFDYPDKCQVYSIRQSYYMRGFMDCLFCRESCYRCDYAQEKRVGDITLGDFWGIGKKITFDNPEKRKVSLVLVNTTKGSELIKELNDSVMLYERTIEEAIEGNPQLTRPSYKYSKSDRFQQLYPKLGWTWAARLCYPKMWMRLILEKMRVIKKVR